MDERPRSPARAGPTTSEEPSLDELEFAEGLDDLLRLPADARLADAMQVEARLAAEIRTSGFSGQAWDIIEDTLIDYGYQVMTLLLRTGLIFARCAENGLFLPAQHIPPDEQGDLAQETVVAALGAFQDSFARGKGWDPAGDASLRTFFRRGLLFQFANVWRKRIRAAPPADGPRLDELTEVPHPGPGPLEVCEQRDLVRRELADISSDRTRVALVLTADGYEQEEIAEILGVTARSVEGYLRRHRERTRQKSQEEGR